MEPGNFTQYCLDPLNHKGFEVSTGGREHGAWGLHTVLL